MMRLQLGLMALMLGVPTAAAAAADTPPAVIADEHRLSPAEVQKVLDSAAISQAVAAQSLDPLNDLPPPRIEGEMGVAIGTGGYREAFGTAIVPLGKDGEATFSFDTIESHRGRYIRRY